MLPPRRAWPHRLCCYAELWFWLLCSELKKWEELTYSWGLIGATVGGAVTPRKLAAMEAHKKKKNATDMQHYGVLHCTACTCARSCRTGSTLTAAGADVCMYEQALASIGYSIDDLAKMQENAADIEKRVSCLHFGSVLVLSVAAVYFVVVVAVRVTD